MLPVTTMTSTPKSTGEGSNLSESWVDLSVSPGRLTPVTIQSVGFVNAPVSSTGTYGTISSVGEEYLRLLREAQRESNHSSAIVSLASSTRNSRCESPKSPPNSPNNELATSEEDFQGVFINNESEGAKEWVLNYLTARCESQPQRSVSSAHHNKSRKEPTKSNNSGLSLRNGKFSGKSLFSKEILYTLFVSNFLSLLIGTGIGLWLSKRSAAISQFPLN